jgi:hypothetical protein
VTYLALPRPPGFKPRHARKSKPHLLYAVTGGTAAAVVVGFGAFHSGTGPASAAEAPTTVTGQVSNLSCVQATSFGHPAGTAWKLTFLITNPSSAKATYYLNWSLRDSRGTPVGTGTAEVPSVEPGTTTHSGVFTLDEGTTASTQTALGEKMTCKLTETQRQPTA